MQLKPAHIAAFATAVLVLLGGAGTYLATHRTPAPGAPAAAASGLANAPDQNLVPDLAELLAYQRKVIVLLADEKKLKPEERARANQVGQQLFHDGQLRATRLRERVEALLASGKPGRLEAVAQALDYVESGPDMFDADRLAFREALRAMEMAVAKDSALPAIKLHKRIGEDLEALADIERTYEKEMGQIFSRFDSRAITPQRERWQDYVAKLQGLYNREQILKDYGVILPYPVAKEADKDEPDGKEITGSKLPPKTLVLTFDDGPHARYTEEIAAVLKQYGVPGVFFEVGHNLGTVDAQGQPKLGANAAVARRLRAAGFELANHSFSHAQLTKQTGDALQHEISNADALLKAVDAKRSPLFRFPYGARNAEGLQRVGATQLTSVMWNIDSLDWADPIPSSIADRVLRQIDKEGRGIVLFHDIHERTIKALPLILDRLVADGYQFAGWDGNGFSVAKATGGGAAEPRQIVTTGYNDSWAIVIGINNYTKWPKLQYATRDAAAMRQALVEKFGFAPDKVIALSDAEATRNNILAAFHDKLAHGVKPNDRILVFFAGHGATRKLSSGRDVGYIVPVDSDPNQLATDAIAMTEIQNISESLSAKHVLFLMDACYSGLGLTRGGAAGNSFLRDNAKRVGRQMLTAGGADQTVADGGPNGHSIFTWTLLQGLAGKADLNGDRMITATELAAYMAPAVSAVSAQTPAFGSLPGSQGGEFVFELAGDGEFLSAGSGQLSSDAIALNSKLDTARHAAPTPAASQPVAASAVVVKDLQGNDQKLVAQPVAAGALSARQLAQRANDQGLQFFKERRYTEAEAQFTEALKLRPDFALAANNLGFVYFKQDRFEEAARWFDNTIKLDPSRAIAYANLGDALLKQGRKDDARKAYQRIAELAPGSKPAAYATEKLKEL